MHGKALKKEVREVLESLNLYKVRHKPVRAFSGGMKRRLSVGMGTCPDRAHTTLSASRCANVLSPSLRVALMGDPKLILLDEPSTYAPPSLKRSWWLA
jgi:ABC-type multidrug transport system ATPase subunit